MFFKTNIIISLFLLFGLSACITPSRDAARPEPGPLGKEFTTYQPPLNPTLLSSASSELEAPMDVLTLNQALALALMRNPELAAFAWEIRAQEARALQAALLPNPELASEFENIGGSGTLQGTDGAETTIELSQLIELAGKRKKRARVAGLERDLAGWDYETKRVDVLTEVRQAFVNVLAAQEQLTLANEIVHLAEDVFKTVSARVRAGKVSPLEEIKARVALASIRIKRERAKGSLETARLQLAATWGHRSADFEKVEGELDEIMPIPPIDDLFSRLSQNPDIARWDLEIEQRRASVKLEEARRIPDLTLGGGVRRFNETEDHAFILGLSIPIPLFDRNQGGVLEARIRMTKANEERQASVVRAGTALAEAYRVLSSAYTEVTALKSEVLPGAQTAFEAASEGYRQGKFGFLEVLDAQRTFFEAKGQYLEALAAYHQSRAVVERLIGEPLDTMSDFPRKMEEGEKE